MGKKSRKKRIRRGEQQAEQPDLALRQVPYPFEGVPPDVLKKGMVEIGRGKAQRFPITTSVLHERLGRVEPLCLLSAVAGYGLAVGIADDGTVQQSALSKIQPSHVELLQALCLRAPLENHNESPALGDLVQEICDTVVEWSEEFHAKRLVQLEAVTTDLERNRLGVQENIRVATQMVRNWGYYDQVKRLVSDLMAPLEPSFEKIHGFRSQDLILIFDYLFHEWQRRINDHWDRLRPMMNAPTLRDAIREYLAAFPDVGNTVEDMMAEMRSRHASKKAAQLLMLSHSDLRLTDVFSFDQDDIAKSVGRPIDVIALCLKSVSFAFGDLADHNVEHFFLNNPVWTRPVIALPDGRWFCVMPNSIFAFWFEMIRRLVKADDALRDLYDQRRSDYLELQTRQLFTSALPGAVITPNFKWKSPDGSQEFESDLVIKIDSFLVIVECKSGRVPPESRRGAPESLGEIVDSLLVEPSRQSRRLEKAVIAAQSGEAGTEAFLKVFPVDLKAIHRVIRLSVTLEDVSFLQTHLTALKKCGYVPQELDAAPAVTIADLETVFDVLRSLPERVHYWVRRGEWEQNADYLADEIDLLGVYLKTGLDVGDLEFGKAHLMLIGESKKIDEFYEARRNGITIEKPKYQAIDWWREMLNRLETKQPSRWLEGAVVLLCAGWHQQIELERRTKSIVADVKRRRERARSQNALIFVPSKERREGICILVLTRDQMPDRHQKMENVAGQVFESNANVDHCVVIVLDVDGQMYPYSTFGVFFRRAGEP